MGTLLSHNSMFHLFGCLDRNTTTCSCLVWIPFVELGNCYGMFCLMIVAVSHLLRCQHQFELSHYHRDTCMCKRAVGFPALLSVVHVVPVLLFWAGASSSSSESLLTAPNSTNGGPTATFPIHACCRQDLR